MNKSKQFNLVFSTNNKYVPFLNIAIRSVLYNTKSFVNIFILESNVNKHRKKRLIENLKDFKNFKIKFIKINLRKFSKFPLCAHFTHDVYSKFLIPNLLPDVDRAIYLDSDVILLEDIALLYNTSINGFILGAVQEYRDEKSIRWVRQKLLLKGNISYFNSGVLLIDCKKWRDRNITGELLRYAGVFSELFSVDQDILNKVFHEKYMKLDKRYNLIKRDFVHYTGFSKKRRGCIDQAVKNIVVRHFTGVKPWESNQYQDPLGMRFKMNHFEEFWLFAKSSAFYVEVLKAYKKNIRKNIFY